MKNYTYTIFIIFIVILAYVFPTYFQTVGGVKLTKYIPWMLMLIMFGMGTTMTKDDFLSIAKNPKGVWVGLICQFLFMPLIGFSLTKIFSFPAEIAAGIVLIGSSPSGLASNVMAFIAKANVALSITITSIATLLAPVLTPFFMKFYGGGYVEVDFWGMMWSIMQTVIFPIALGYLINTFMKPVAKAIQPILPFLSMIGIAYIILTVTAAGHDSLAQVGLLLLVAVFIHNMMGFILGYFTSRKLFNLPEQDARTIAIETGLQNGGLASALALQMGKVATVGLAATLFGPLMNITGSLLASYWSRKN